MKFIMIINLLEFRERIVNKTNSLDKEVATVETINAFKSYLGKLSYKMLRAIIVIFKHSNAS